LKFEGENMPVITRANLDNWFANTRVELSREDARKIEVIRDHGHLLSRVILENTPPSADQTAAIRKIREACSTAVDAILCGGE
jgi:hypothetical protein